MKKKIAVLATGVLVLAFAGNAYAQTVNTYDVNASTTPAGAGTKSKGVPVGVNFGFSVGTKGGERPSPVKKYSIRFGGLVVNTDAFPKCSAATLEAKGPKGCAAGSKVGSGWIENATGSASNPFDESVVCNAELGVYNAGGNKGVIYVAGSPNATDARKKCAIELAAPIPAKFVKRGNATALEFNVPTSLTHPLPTLNNAVKKITSKVNKLTVKRAGKTVGFFESRGGCTGGKRDISVVFSPEQGAQATAKALARCSA